jgi:hypothetical protein
MAPPGIAGAVSFSGFSTATPDHAEFFQAVGLPVRFCPIDPAGRRLPGVLLTAGMRVTGS